MKKFSLLFFVISWSSLMYSQVEFKNIWTAKDSIEKYTKNKSSQLPNFKAINGDTGFILHRNDSIIKQNSNKNIVWSYPLDLYLNIGIKFDLDDNIIIWDAYQLHKFDQGGNKIFSIDFKEYNKDYFITCLSIDSNNNYILAGQNKHPWQKERKHLILELSQNGSLNKELIFNPKTPDFKVILPSHVFALNGFYYLTTAGDSIIGSAVYKVNKKGKRVKHLIIPTTIDRIWLSDNRFITMTHSGGYFGNAIQIISINEKLKYIEKFNYSPAINGHYNTREVINDSLHTIKHPKRFYKPHDFLITSEGNFLIVGNSNQARWIISFDKNGNKNWEWTGKRGLFDETMLSIDEITSIQKIGNKYFIHTKSQKEKLPTQIEKWALTIEELNFTE